ncbi:MAG: hypothetical protein ABSE73_22025 [Planctomycetota bacterium]
MKSRRKARSTRTGRGAGGCTNADVRLAMEVFGLSEDEAGEFDEAKYADEAPLACTKTTGKRDRRELLYG